MDRETWMFFRAVLSGSILMGAAVLAAGTLSGLGNSPLTAGLLQTLRWGPMVLFGVGVLQAGAGAYRFVQWCRGAGYECDCGALLGPMPLSRSYRRCLGCGRRHYD